MSNANGRVDCTRLRAAIEKSFDMLGTGAKNALLFHLKDNGISLFPPCSKLTEVEGVLVGLFGDDAASLFIQRIHAELKN